MRRVHRATVTVTAAVSAVLLIGGCGSEAPARMNSGGWSAPFADAHNSRSVTADGPRSPTPIWSRPLGGVIPQSVTTGPEDQVIAAARTGSGCTIFSFDGDTGRKSWCNPLDFGGAISTPLVDRNDNSYFGGIGSMFSFNTFGQTRWRTPVAGTPIGMQFLPDGNLLVLTQLGQLNVLNPQTGAKIVASVELVPGTDTAPGDWGLDQCQDAGPLCVAANPPAVDESNGHVYLTFWKPGAFSASLIAMAYGPQPNTAGTPVLRQLWTNDTLPGGANSAPALSADGKTVYEVDRQGGLWAVDAATGRSRWSHQLTPPVARSVSVSPDGLIIPAPAEQGPLIALRDKGDRAEVAWERKDLTVVGPASQAGGGVGYVLTRSGADGIALTTFDTGSGTTLDQKVLPGAQGFGAGVSISHDGTVIAPTRIGELFAFK